MYSNFLSQTYTQIKRLRYSSAGATGLEYTVSAAGVGMFILALVAFFSPNSYAWVRTYGSQIYQVIREKIRDESIGNSFAGALGDIPGITDSVTWGTTTEPVAGWVGDYPIEIGTAVFFAPNSGKPPSGSNLVIEIDGNAGESDVIRKDFSYIPSHTNIEIDIESSLRVTPGTDINQDGIDLIWNGEKVSTVRSAEQGVWAVDKIVVNTSDGDGSGQLALASADNATSFDNGVGMLISDIKVTIP